MCIYTEREMEDALDDLSDQHRGELEKLNKRIVHLKQLLDDVVEENCGLRGIIDELNEKNLNA